MGNLTFDSSVTLSNGRHMPLLGLSTEELGRKVFNIRTQKEFLLDAIEMGYRYFDTAETHQTQRALGQAIRESGIPREEFFISSKMRVDEMGDGRFYEAFEENLIDLEMDYIDLYSIHWPVVMNSKWPAEEAYITGYTGREITKFQNGDAEGLIQCYEEGKARAIGVCNYEVHHLEKLMASPKCTVKPMVVQGQFHPLYQSKEVREFCEKNEILFGGLLEHNYLVQETKPRYFNDVNRIGLKFQEDERAILANKYGNIVRDYDNTELQKSPFDEYNNPRKLENYYDRMPVLIALGEKYGKTPAQIVIRFTLQSGVVAAPSTIRRDRLAQYKDVFDFCLTHEEMQLLTGMDAGLRFGYHPDYIDF